MTTTRWSQVLAARDGAGTEAREALEDLCRVYWEPLYAFIRYRGWDAEEARDLTQAFFADLIEKRRLDSVDPSKGRFRSFLLTSLKYFLSHERERAQALKRGGGVDTVSLDAKGAEARLGLGGSDERSPEQVFEHRWAVTMLNRALERLHQLSVDAGTQDQFEALRPYLTDAETNPATYTEVGARLGMSEGAVKMAVSRLRKRLGQSLRHEVAETVAAVDQVDDEVRHIIANVRL